MTDMAAQRSALDEARKLRAEFLIALHEHRIEPLDVVEDARHSWALPLRQLRLDRVFLESGMSARRWRLIRDRMLDVLVENVPPAKLTVGWVLDPRAGGRRHYALGDAVRERITEPWPGFPWQPPPGANAGRKTAT